MSLFRNREIDRPSLSAKLPTPPSKVARSDTKHRRASLTHDGRAPAGASRRKTPHTQVVRSRKRAQRHVLPMLGGGRTAPRPHPNPARARRKCGKVSNFTIRCVLLMLNTRLNTTLTNIIILNYSKNYRGKSDCTKISCNRNTPPLISTSRPLPSR